MMSPTIIPPRLSAGRDYCPGARQTGYFDDPTFYCCRTDEPVDPECCEACQQEQGE